MENSLLKVRLSVLWIFVAVSISAHSILSFMEPEMLQQVLSGEMAWGSGMMFFMALFWWVPLVMAVLTVTLKDVANRWANMILGIVFTLFNIVHLMEHFAQPSIHQLLIVCSTIVVTALIFWFALRWPKQEV